MEFEVSAELVSIYLEDAREQLAVLDGVLLRLEREGATPEVDGLGARARCTRSRATAA